MDGAVGPRDAKPGAHPELADVFSGLTLNPPLRRDAKSGAHPELADGF